MMTVISPSHPLSDHTEAVRSVLVFTFKEIFFPIVTKAQPIFQKLTLTESGLSKNFLIVTG